MFLHSYLMYCLLPEMLYQYLLHHLQLGLIPKIVVPIFCNSIGIYFRRKISCIYVINFENTRLPEFFHILENPDLKLKSSSSTKSVCSTFANRYVCSSFSSSYISTCIKLPFCTFVFMCATEV